MGSWKVYIGTCRLKVEGLGFWASGLGVRIWPESLSPKPYIGPGGRTCTRCRDKSLYIILR